MLKYNPLYAKIFVKANYKLEITSDRFGDGGGTQKARLLSLFSFSSVRDFDLFDEV